MINKLISTTGFRVEQDNFYKTKLLNKDSKSNDDAGQFCILETYLNAESCIIFIIS